MAMTGGTAKLVKTTYPFSDKTKAVNLYVYYKTSQSIENNKSTITVGMYVTTPSGWDIGPWYKSTDSYIGTTGITFDGAVPNFSGTRWLVENKTFTVDHKTDGTGTATIHWKWGVNSPWGGYVNPSGSFSITLPTIPRATAPTLSATSVQMGKSITVTMNRAASSFTHKLKYTINGKTGDIASGLGTSYTWTIPKTLVQHIPNLLKATVTIICETYSGTTLVGSKSVSFTATVPNTSVPALSASSVEMGKAVTITTNREVSYYTHTLKYTLNGTTGTIATGVGASTAWTIPDLVALIPNATSGDAVITCETYNGTVKVGSKTIGLKITAYPASDPTIPSSAEMGSTISLTMNRKSAKYTHLIQCTLGNSVFLIANEVGASTSWAIPATLVTALPNATSGTATIKCTTYNGTATIGSVEKTFTLNVPSASVPTLTATSVTMGKPFRVTINSKSTEYTHSLRLVLGKAQSLKTDISDAYYDLTVPLSFASQIPTATIGDVTLECVTKNGTATVGTHTMTIKAYVPNDDTTKPNFTMTFKPEHSLADKFKDVFVQRKSKVNVTFEADSEYADIKSYSIKVMDAIATGNPCTSVLLTRSGEITVAGTVTDSRGYSRTIEQTIPVVAYVPPSLAPIAGNSALVCTRSKQDGTVYLMGEYALIQARASYSNVEGYNNCTIKYRYKLSSSADYDVDWKLLNGTEVNNTLEEIFNIKNAYVLQLWVQDDVGEERLYSFPIPYVSLPIHEGEGGRNLGLGQYCDYSEQDRIDIGWKTYFNTGIGKRVIFEAPDGLGWEKGTVLEEVFDDADTTSLMNYTVFLAIVANTTGSPIVTRPVLCIREGLNIYGCTDLRGTSGTDSYILQIGYSEKYKTTTLNTACRLTHTASGSHGAIENLDASGTTNKQLVTALYALL